MEIYELTEEHYKIAAQNGISRRLAYHRFYNSGWDAMDAITRPKARPVLKELQAKARENGIELSTVTIYYRKKLGWSDERIITTEINADRKLANHYEKIAAQNGICKATYRARRRRGWTEHDACTVPVNTLFRRKDLG